MSVFLGVTNCSCLMVGLGAFFKRLFDRIVVGGVQDGQGCDWITLTR